jgi:hypothetical protein
MASLKASGVSSRTALVVALALGALLLGGCNKGRRVLLNQTATTLGSHRMSIQPVGRWHSSIFGGQQQDADGKQMWVFSAGETKIVVKEEQLSVNGKSYGKLKEGDHVDVAFGKVFVNNKEVAEGGALASR